MNEIRFRGSEEQVLEEVGRRRDSFIVRGIGCPYRCTFCGSFRKTIADAATRTVECENCFAKRRYRELVGGND